MCVWQNRKQTIWITPLICEVSYITTTRIEKRYKYSGECHRKVNSFSFETPKQTYNSNMKLYTVVVLAALCATVRTTFVLFSQQAFHFVFFFFVRSFGALTQYTIYFVWLLWNINLSTFFPSFCRPYPQHRIPRQTFPSKNTHCRVFSMGLVKSLRNTGSMLNA